MSLAVARRRGLARHPVAAALKQLVLTEVASDNFDGAGGALSAGWTASDDGAIVDSGNEALGASGAIKGARRTDTYDSDQYSQAAIGSLTNTTSDFQGVTVRNNASTGACYAAIYFVDGSNIKHLQLYKRTSGPGGFTEIADPNESPSFAQGNVLRMVAEGSQITILVDDVPWLSVIDASPLAGGTPGIVTFGAVSLDNWQGGNAHTAAVGAATVTDTFTRADGGMSVGSSGLWTPMSGYPAVDIPIVSDQLSVQSGLHAADVRTDAFNADHWSALKMGAAALVAGSGGFVGVLTRVDAGLDSGYLAACFAANAPISGFTAQTAAAVTYRIYRLDSGTSHLIAACNATGTSNNNAFNLTGNEYKLVSQGSRHSLRVNDHEVLAATDSTYATGKPGTMCFPPSTADNWSGGNV